MKEFNLSAFNFKPKIVVIGVGGGGSNSVNQMIADDIDQIDYWVLNTDAQALIPSNAEHKYVLGEEITKGLGAGGDPEIGYKAAEASAEDIKEIVQNANMVFIAAGMGGGTGTGAAPVVARIAKECGCLTVAIVTRPFSFEGKTRKMRSVDGLQKLKENVDSMIVVSNDKLMMMNGNNGLKSAFAEADKVLSRAVKTITDLILLPGLINIDFADIKALLKDKGVALIGYGCGSGATKVVEAANNAINSPLLEASIKGAKSAIVNVTIGNGVSLDNVQDAVSIITEAAGTEFNIVLGIQENSEFDDEMIISIIATDFDKDYLSEDETVVTSPVRKITPIIDKVPTPSETSEQPSVSSNSILPAFFNSLNKDENNNGDENK